VQVLEGNKIDSIPKLHYYLTDLFSRGTTSPLHLIITFSQTTIEKLPASAGKMDRSIALDRVGENIYEIRIRMKKRGATGWLVTKDNVWLFYIKAEESSLVGSVADAWISGMNPFITHARIPPSGLFELLDSLNQVAPNGIRIDDYLARSYRLDRGNIQSSRGWASQKGWTGDKYDRRKLEKSTAATDTILYATKLVFPNEKTSFTARVSRQGHVTFYEGSEQGFSNFYTLLVDNYIEKAVWYERSLQNKQVRVTEKESIVNPIIFEARRPLGKADFDLMIEALTNEPDYMVSIVHFGNPWLNLSVVDRADGNACEIYGFEDEIQIIPQFKSTPQGLARLEDLVYGVFPSVTKIQEKKK
jgi:hypothetical protein